MHFVIPWDSRIAAKLDRPVIFYKFMYHPYGQALRADKSQRYPIDTELDLAIFLRYDLYRIYERGKRKE